MLKTSEIERAIVAHGLTIQTLHEFEVLENLSLKLSKRKLMPYSDCLSYGNRTDKEFFKILNKVNTTFYVLDIFL